MTEELDNFIYDALKILSSEEIKEAVSIAIEYKKNDGTLKCFLTINRFENNNKLHFCEICEGLHGAHYFWCSNKDRS